MPTLIAVLNEQP